ncbi:MAG: penicillin-binding protein 1A [Salibacteraceae bacterium]|jgi:penicillin-binding protein 1A
MTTKTDKPKFTKFVLSLWAVFLGGLGVVVLFFWALSSGWIWELPSFEELENPKSVLASEVYSSDLEVLGKFYIENRTFVPFEQLPDTLVGALVNTEDERFYNHSGIDIKRLVAAIAALGTRGGASTISQQLAKLLFSERSMTKIDRIKYKLMEWVIAVKLERQYTKNEIIAMYLNKFDFNHNAKGIESAAQIYFGKSAKNLAIDECAILVGMLKNPTYFNPVGSDEKRNRTFHRRNTVYGQMAKNEYITIEQKDSLNQLPLRSKYSTMTHVDGKARYFRAVLKKELKKMLALKNENDNYVYSKPDGTPYNLYKDGLKIYTTINSKLQEYAEYAVAEHLSKELQVDFDKNNKKWRNPPFSNDLDKKQIARILNSAKKRSPRFLILTGKQCSNCGRRGDFVEKSTSEKGQNIWICTAQDCQHVAHRYPKDSIDIIFNESVPMKVFTWSGDVDTSMTPMDSIRYYKSFLQSGLMSMDPHTGEIRAWVGGINYKYFQYDHVRQGKRQVGSTFKPFVYALAIQNGLSPCYEVPNVKTTFYKGEYALQKDWTPSNSDGKYGDMVTLKYGLANSMNTVTAWVMKQYGPAAVIEYARRMGVTSRLDTVPALALGVADISLFEMVGALSTFPGKGIWHQPIFISRIEDKNGVVIADFVAESREAMSEENAYTMLSLLEGVTHGARGPYLGKDESKWGTTRKIGTGMRLYANSLNRDYDGFPRNYPIAGKTGTTQNNSDGWFMGLTPDLVTGVWVGAEDRSVRFMYTSKGQGANTALPIWGYYMKKAWADTTLNLSKQPFERPSNYSMELDCQIANSDDATDFGSSGGDIDFSNGL